MVKMGRPTSPSRTYTAWLKAPHLRPRSSPAMAVNRYCSVTELYTIGIRRNAPTAVSAANRAV